MNPPRLLSLLSPLLIACLALGPTRSWADEAQTVTVTVPKGDKIAIRIPSAWQQRVIQPKPEFAPTVRITSSSGATSLQLTFIPDPEGRFATKESVEKMVTMANQQYVAGSVEKKLTLIPLVSKSGPGSYSNFTDADLAGVKSPGLGQFKNVTSGVLVIKKQAVAFTLLSSGLDGPEHRQALQIVTDGMSAQ